MTFTPKWRFDLVLAVVIGAWFGIGRLLFRGLDIDVFLVQGSAILTFLFLSAAISLGPLARLWRPATHFIYNRRHLGVTTWALAVFHAACVMHYGNSWNPANLLEVLPGQKLWGVPFTLYGVAALLILTAMALTSWDYFLHAWGAPGWKRLHMAVYVAYGFVVMHFLARLLGDPPVARRLLILLVGVATIVAALHIAAAIKEARGDRPAPAAGDGLILLGTFTELLEGRATTVHVNGERIAIVRKEGALYALSNVCPHQNGPLGEGLVRDGYLECPWHGHQFDPRTGLGPPGFSDSVPTYELVTKGHQTYLRARTR
ncbi:MAG TPA: Rieske 2Fe-2S domain-containing protein [Verrucomicrobiae bacterium]|nr:Rieske 2Fe-2S domain-containing protein [Verrucomicrobiae bacterium]